MMSALKIGSEMMDRQEECDQPSYRNRPGPIKDGAISPENEVTLDGEFKKWESSRVALETVHKGIALDVYDEMGRIALVCRIWRCWVSEFLGMQDLKANPNALPIQLITLETEGWERVNNVKEASEPSP